MLCGKWVVQKVNLTGLVERIACATNRAQANVSQRRKPFDVLAEGLIFENSRGNKTAIELFIAGIRRWEAGLRRSIVELPNGTRP
jgi:hypothetical protein